ncbi:MAG: methylated-DNA--[protein]-cysteine S-methyltransferase [Bacteroidota bacterium]
MPIYTTFYASPLGILAIQGNDQAITSVAFAEEKDYVSAEVPNSLQTCVQQLGEYFSGSRQVFSFPIAQPGTDFQQKVWNVLLSVPFGQTASYLHIAQLLNNPGSVRAVGMANGRNNLAIVVPCHRIIGNNGKLVGYAGGLWRKQWLLEHERKQTGQGQLALF